MFTSNRLEKIKRQGTVILKSRFLSSMTPLQRYEFLQLCHRRNYLKGDYVYYQNDPGTGMYFIESGRVQLVVEQVAESPDKAELTCDMSAPESFGALSIGYELRRMSSARCLTDCVLLGFFKPDFETLKSRQPVIAVKFLETLSTLAMKQLDKTTRKLEEATDIHTAFSVQFMTVYGDEEEERV